MTNKKAILINDTSNECHIGSYNVIDNIVRLCRKNGIKIIGKFTRHEIEDGKRAKELKRKIQDSDIIIINGEGSLHHHPRRNTRWFPILLKMIPDGKKTVLINTIWQDMDKLGKDIKYLNKLNLISVRESYSYNDLLSIYPKKEKVIITPDIIFTTEIDNKITEVGYGDSVHIKLREILAQKKMFFPLGYIHKGTYRKIKEIQMPTLYSYQMWLKSLKLYVTGRFHGVCLSALAGVPFLALESNSHKIQAILADMRCPELLISNLEEIENKTQQAMESLPKINKYVKEAKDKIEILFKRIAQL